MNFLIQISQGFALCRKSLEFWADIIRKPNDAIDYGLFHVLCLDVFYDGLGRSPEESVDYSAPWDKFLDQAEYVEVVKIILGEVL